MRSFSRRWLWLAAGVVLLIVVALGGYLLGASIGHPVAGARFAPFRGFLFPIGGYGLFSWLLFFVVIGAGIALFVNVLTPPRRPDPPTAAGWTPATSAGWAAPAATGSGPATSPAPSRPMGTADQLERLAALHRDGVLTSEEFAAAKRRLLNL